MSLLSGAATSIVTHPVKWFLRVAVALAVMLAVIVGAVGWAGSERAINPVALTDLPSPADYDLPVEDAAFLSRDGTGLSGWFLAARDAATLDRPTVVLLHGYRSRKERMLRHADYLHEAGYNVLLFDFRASGGSEGDRITLGAREQLDALGALDYLAARGDIEMTRVGFQGVSMGAAVAIMAAARDARVAAVAAEAPFKDIPSMIGTSFQHFIGLPAFPFAPVTVWITERRLGIRAAEISPLRAAPDLAGRPLLLIADEQDTLVSPRHVDAIFEAAGEPKARWLAPGAEHADGHEVAPEQYEALVLGFWAEAFAAPDWQ